MKYLNCYHRQSINRNVPLTPYGFHYLYNREMHSSLLLTPVNMLTNILDCLEQHTMKLNLASVHKGPVISSNTPLPLLKASRSH